MILPLHCSDLILIPPGSYVTIAPRQKNLYTNCTAHALYDYAIAQKYTAKRGRNPEPYWTSMHSSLTYQQREAGTMSHIGHLCQVAQL
jgi:hypothetical protein